MVWSWVLSNEMTPDVRPQMAQADRLSAMCQAICSLSSEDSNRLTSIESGTRPGNKDLVMKYNTKIRSFGLRLMSNELVFDNNWI